MLFIAELKRRNVIRIGILYGVIAWLLMQFTDVLSSLLSLPAWTGSLVVMLLVLGFLPVMVFAWIYELTPDGLKRDEQVDRSRPGSSAAAHRINVLIVGLLVVAIATVVLDRVIPGSGPAPATVSEPAVGEVDDAVEENGVLIRDASIAVLPFADLSADQDQRYFADGISEELLNVLARVESLKVASRTSAFSYRDSRQKVSEIGRELQVANVLEGSVRKDRQRIRITAQLIDVRTDKHLWSETYDRDLSDIFKVQDEIANAIVKALVDKLGVARDAGPLTLPPATGNMDAYELYLKGRDLFNRRVGLSSAIRYFEQAIALDPAFARAWETMAAALWVVDDYVPSDVSHRPAAAEAAKRAIELDASLSMGYAVLASSMMYENADRDWAAGFDYYDRAIVNDPNSVTAFAWRGTSFTDAGFPDRAIPDLQRCLELDPKYLLCHWFLAIAYINMGDDVAGIRHWETAVLSNYRTGNGMMVGAYVRQGMRTMATVVAGGDFPRESNPPLSAWIEALETPGQDQSEGLEKFDAWSRESGVPFAFQSPLLGALQAYDRIDRSGVETIQSVWMPEMHGYRQTEYFRQLVRDTGILKYWQDLGFPLRCRPLGKDDFRCD
jgi:adenylate cyclase